uniref:Uncharacterized protein n=1 Tax=Rhizophora mucronata TaxID=61149 RepID=A0A2P2QFE2_RHIMU
MVPNQGKYQCNLDRKRGIMHSFRKLF